MLVTGTPAYKRYQTEVDTFKELKKQILDLTEKHRNLDTRKNENQLVKTELDLLEDEAVVYKRAGPALVKQDVEEARTDVSSKLRIIKSEMAKIDKQVKNLDAKAQQKEQKIIELRAKCLAVPYANQQGRGGAVNVRRG